MTNQVCNICQNNPVAVNYKRNGKTYYRKTCYYCNKKKKSETELPNQLLKKSGYKKKAVCDRCGFKSKTSAQMEIYYRDNNIYNVSLSNLRSYCSNCIIEIKTNPDAAKKNIIADY